MTKFFFHFVEKKFSFLNPDEIAKMKEEEERRIAQMTRFEFEKMTNAASREAESWTDATLEDVEAIDKMARGQPAPKRSLDSGPHSIPYTAKGERLLRERLEREGEPLPEDLENLDNLSPEEKKAVDAERRAAWRKARLKSLENVRNFQTFFATTYFKLSSVIIALFFIGCNSSAISHSKNVGIDNHRII